MNQSTGSNVAKALKLQRLKHNCGMMQFLLFSSYRLVPHSGQYVKTHEQSVVDVTATCHIALEGTAAFILTSFEKHTHKVRYFKRWKISSHISNRDHISYCNISLVLTNMHTRNSFPYEDSSFCRCFKMFDIVCMGTDDRRIRIKVDRKFWTLSRELGV
jgi:hypothetical protein